MEQRANEDNKEISRVNEYIDNLKIVNGIRFTEREIEITEKSML
jgi:hypothetical protein